MKNLIVGGIKPAIVRSQIRYFAHLAIYFKHEKGKISNISDVWVFEHPSTCDSSAADQVTGELLNMNWFV